MCINIHIYSTLVIYGKKIYKRPQILNYRDSRVDRQRRWPEALFGRLATLPLSDFVPLNSNLSPKITTQ